MNARLAYNLNSQFGPLSEQIDIGKFIKNASEVKSRTTIVYEDSQESRDSLAEECSVEDIKSSIFNVWNDPQSSVYLCKEHETTINCLYGNSKSARPRKKDTTESQSLSQAIVGLQSKLDRISLASWKLPPQASLFIRAPKNSDLNIYSGVKKTFQDESPEDLSPQAIITYSVHNRLLWRSSHLTRSSQHRVQSSQTLGDLVEAIPCESNELPAEKRDGSRIVGYDSDTPMTGSHGAVICINGLAYGDGMTENDYGSKLVAHAKLNNSTGKLPKLEKAEISMHDAPLQSLSLTIGEPYWLLHEGNCEHFVVIDGIRLKHSTDPPFGYPLTLNREPTVLETCLACSRAPAVWSIIGDVRLGESPCFLCAWCWRQMGESTDNNVLIIPLPKHKFGWS
ncbi:hypothetical protein L218DRAFT_927869 [Marasmius fiardii PR-910]|nr:hypothetical protein L218DRAFT_927869 [Marasmius fiardii PR-910]